MVCPVEWAVSTSVRRPGLMVVPAAGRSGRASVKARAVATRASEHHDDEQGDGDDGDDPEHVHPERCARGLTERGPSLRASTVVGDGYGALDRSDLARVLTEHGGISRVIRAMAPGSGSSHAAADGRSWVPT